MTGKTSIICNLEYSCIPCLTYLDAKSYYICSKIVVGGNMEESTAIHQEQAPTSFQSLKAEQISYQSSNKDKKLNQDNIPTSIRY